MDLCKASSSEIDDSLRENDSLQTCLLCRCISLPSSLLYTPSLLLITSHFCCATRWWWRACLRCDCALKKRLAPGSLLACNAGSHSLIPSSTICIHNVLFLEGLEIELSRQTVCSLFFVCLLFFTFLPVSPGADVEWIVWAVYIMKLGLLMWDCCLALHSSEREHWRWWVPLEFLHLLHSVCCDHVF